MRIAYNRAKELKALYIKAEQEWMKGKSIDDFQAIPENKRSYYDAHQNSLKADALFKALKECYIPKLYRECRFENYDFGHIVNLELPDDDFAESERWCKFLQSEKNLTESFFGNFFTGIIGVGKTHLAVSTMKAVVEMQRVRSLFIPQLKLNQHIRTIFHSKESAEYYERCMGLDHILIDDLGEGQMTDIVREYTIALIKHRIDAMKRTDITSNFTWEELEKIFDARLMDRIKAYFHVMPLIGKSYRKKVKVIDED